MNEIKITDVYRDMFVDKIRLSLDELLFTMRTAIIIKLDDNKAMFGNYYEEIYNEIFQTRDYDLSNAFQTAIKKYRIVKDQIDRLEIEINYMICKFNRKQAKNPYQNIFFIEKDSNGNMYEEYSDVFFRELEKNQRDGFTFCKATIAKNLRNSMGKVVSRSVGGVWVSYK